MGRLEAMAAWFFSGLGIVLLAGSILVVPAKAFADAGDDCWEMCAEDPDPACTQYCCENACGADETCIAECTAQVVCAVGTVPYCKVWGTKILCEAYPNDCQGSLAQCQCLWKEKDTIKCRCRVVGPG